MAAYMNFNLNLDNNPPFLYPYYVLDILEYSVKVSNQKLFSSLKVKKKRFQRFINQSFIKNSNDYVTLIKSPEALISEDSINERYLNLIESLLNPYIDHHGPIFTQDRILNALCMVLNSNKIKFDKSLLMRQFDKVMVIILDTIQGVEFETQNNSFIHYLGNIERKDTERGPMGKKLSIIVEVYPRHLEKNAFSLPIPMGLIQNNFITSNLNSLDYCENRLFDNIISFPPRRYRLNNYNKFDFLEE